VKKFKTTLKRPFAEALKTKIDIVIVDNESEDDDDKLLLANLAEISHKLYTKLGDPRKEFTISFTPAHAIAIRLFYTGWFDSAAIDYTTNRLRQIADGIHQQYQ